MYCFIIRKDYSEKIAREAGDPSPVTHNSQLGYYSKSGKLGLLEKTANRSLAFDRFRGQVLSSEKKASNLQDQLTGYTPKYYLRLILVTVLAYSLD